MRLQHKFLLCLSGLYSYQLLSSVVVVIVVGDHGLRDNRYEGLSDERTLQE